MKIKNRIMRLIPIIVIVVALWSCGKSRDVESGVSWELAQLHSQSVSNVNYELEFNIPGSLDSIVRATEKISFKYLSSQDLQIDFKADSVQQICRVELFGKPVKWFYLNEHIVIPNRFLSDSVSVEIEFIAGNRSLNRNPEFMYTLAVPDRARTIYPCFDQPDIKSCYKLRLSVPEEWVAVSNSRVIDVTSPIEGIKRYEFESSLPLSTYHFSFVTGKFECYSEVRNGDTVNLYYRETDPYKVAQVVDAVDLTFKSIDWLENYTGIPMPYTKSDMVVIPGFQFGGMEHPGAILYADHVVFKEKNATPEEYFQRASTIAHENTHLWFGDLVTMKWFNDVWTKEVFANYISAKIIEPEFPELDHNLNFMTSYIAPALAEDRTSGTNAIQQELDNMQNAGLLYGNIIYDKAPVMMRNLEEMMGKERFRAAIQEYLRSFYHANATWDDLIAIMSTHAPELNIEEFSRVWVKEKGMPHLQLSLDSNKLVVEHIDPEGRGLVWPQSFHVLVMDTNRGTGNEQRVNINIYKGEIPLRHDEGENLTLLIPNINGMGYGRITSPDIDYVVKQWHNTMTTREMQPMLMQLYEAYLNGEIEYNGYYNSLMNGIKLVTDVQICNTVVNHLFTLLADAPDELREKIENDLFELSSSHKNSVIRGYIYRNLSTACGSDKYVNHFYNVWRGRTNSELTDNNYINLALSLAIKMPDSADYIIETQRGRITNQDVLRRYDFVSPACSSDTVVMDSVFNALLVAENRAVEPWVQSALSYLNSRYREPYSNKYILPALMELQEVQRTGDIFFPKGWCGALLSGHRSKEALQIVQDFLNDNPNYPQLLKTKLLQSVYNLERIARQ